MKDLLVIYRDENEDQPKIKKGFNGYASEATNKDWLIQKIAKAFLTLVGTNYYDPNFGTVSGDSTGATYNPTDSNLFRQSITQAVDSVEKTIIEQQVNLPDLTDSERLVSIEIQSIVYDKIGATVEVFLLVTMANKSEFNMRV